MLILLFDDCIRWISQWFRRWFSARYRRQAQKYCGIRKRTHNVCVATL